MPRNRKQLPPGRTSVAAKTPIEPLAIYTRREAAAALEMGEDRFSALVAEGAVRCRRDGQRLLFLGEWLLAWVRATDEGSH
jgi:hypothetical protein